MSGDLGEWEGLGAWVEAAKEGERPREEEPRAGDWRNIWVVAEVREGRVRPACIEILGRARALADALGVRVAAVLFGGKGIGRHAATLGWAGADRVWLVEDERFARPDIDLWRLQLRRLIQDKRPELLLAVHEPFHDALAGFLAADLATGAVCGVHAVELDTAERRFVFHVRSFSGQVESQVVVPRAQPQIATVARRSQALPAPDRARQAAVTAVLPEVSRDQARLATEGPFEPVREEGGLANARVVVLCGKGVGGPDGVEKARAVASFLRGEVGGSKAACDLGFLPRDRQVGRMGRRIRPELLIALGVAGTTETLEGLDRSRLRLFLAVDVDPEAPIFDAADVAIVADLHEWVDPFLAEARREEQAVSYQLRDEPG